METICSPFTTVILSQTPSLYNKCFTEFYLGFLVEGAWALLIAAESVFRSKRSSIHPPIFLLSLQLLQFLSYFALITVFLFLLDTAQVSISQFISLCSSLLLWVSVLYSYQVSFSKTGWVFTDTWSLKLFFTLRPLWVCFRLALMWNSTSEEPRASQLLELGQLVPWGLTLFYVGILLVGWCKARRSPSRYFPLVEGDYFEGITEESPKENSYETSSIFAKVFMFWIYKLLRVGLLKPLDDEDIEPPRKIETTEYQKAQLKTYIERFLVRKDDKRALLKALYTRFLGEILLLTLIGGSATLMEFSFPLFIKVLVAFIEDGEKELWRGFALVFYMLLVKLAQAVTNNHFRFNTSLLAGHIRAGISSNIYEKSLKISSELLSSTNSENASYSYAQIVNLMQVDLERISTGLPFSMRAVIWPFQMSFGVYLLIVTVQWQPASSALFLMVILFVFNGLVARFIGRIQKQVMEKKDVRMKYCTELLNNMKVFKLYNWERKIGDRVTEARASEMKLTVKYLRTLLLVIFLNWGTRNYLAICVIVTMSLTQSSIHPGDVFAGITVIALLNMSLRFVPDIISNYMNMIVSINRIQMFLQCKEVPQYLDREQGAQNRDLAIGANEVSFSWGVVGAAQPTGELQESNLILKDLTFSIAKGELVAIVGRVGSGKSSLLQAVIQNMNLVKTSESSHIFVNGSLAYVSQENWIQNCSIKDNILFGSTFDAERYRNVLQVSQLESDLAILPAGDATEIGERGINLSGGQKTRVALARAVYSGHEIFLLDDPLSAVDSHVGRNIFQQCIQNFLAKTTRVLVTNNQQFLPFVDRVFVMHHGELVEQGTFSELMQLDGYFKNEFLVETTQLPELQRQFSEVAERTEDPKEESAPVAQSKIIENEERAVGRVGFWVFKEFFNYMGGMKIVVLVIVIMLLWQGDRMFTDLYLGRWTEQSEDEQKAKLLKNILTYSIAAFSVNLFILARLVVTVSGIIKAAKTIFTNMLTALLNAPINKYFDVTPIGRILNRLSKDQNVIDGPMSFALNGTIGQVFTVFMVISICCYIVPPVLLIVPFTLYFSVRIQRVYLTSSRELVRLESLSRSPIIHHFSETIAGSNTIRAFGYQPMFTHKNAQLINKNMGIFFMQQGSNCWLGITLEFISDLLFAASTFIIVGARGYIDPGYAGLILSYIVTLPDNIYFMILASSFLENMMVSVERTHQLSKIQPEAARTRHKDAELKNWPEHGQIEFMNYQMKYRDDTELVLKGVTGVVGSQEKIGIVGRTGSGKSSLCMALFRIVEPYSGSIFIDGVDITEIGLDKLRQSMCVIPQEPTLFQGTVQDNLDPFHEIPEETLLEAIKTVELLSEEDPRVVLYKQVSENGSNFSLGQRQLICIARAILRNSKIMFLDEATASVDYRTDEVIQKTIRERFHDKTVMTIAHRINTIMDYDRVIVMDQGVIAEFDTPEALMGRKGWFYNLVKQGRNIS